MTLTEKSSVVTNEIQGLQKSPHHQKLGKSIKSLNKLVNFDLKNLKHWLKSNKISFNAKKQNKNKLVIFESKRKQFNGEIKLKSSRKRLFVTDSAKIFKS